MEEWIMTDDYPEVDYRDVSEDKKEIGNYIKKFLTLLLNLMILMYLDSIALGWMVGHSLPDEVDKNFQFDFDPAGVPGYYSTADPGVAVAAVAPTQRGICHCIGINHRIISRVSRRELSCVARDSVLYIGCPLYQTLASPTII